MEPRPFDIVFFDCDSTLSTIEGVDELALRTDFGAEIARLTAAAMDGAMALEEVYARRFELIRPSQTDVDWLGQRYYDTVVDGARESVARLQETGRSVHILSGGVQQSIQVLANLLDIPAANVVGVPIHLTASGEYAGFDIEAPTARSGGKADVIRKLTQDGQRAVMIGDGVTDLEAQQVGVPTIGFGGVIARDTVRQKADAWIGEPSLRSVVDVITALERLPFR